MLEEKVWDNEKGRVGTRKRPFTLEDLVALDTFHWAYEIEVMNRPWWKRLDTDEATVERIDEKFRVQFGPDQLHSAD